MDLPGKGCFSNHERDNPIRKQGICSLCPSWYMPFALQRRAAFLANRRFSWTAVDRIGGFCFLVRGGTQDFCTDLSIPGWDPSAVYGGCHGTGNAAVSQDSQQMGSEGDFGSTLQNCQLVCVDI